MDTNKQWDTVIKPQNKLWDIDFRELWSYRDLYSLFVKRDIVTQYKQTILGPLWFFIQPLLTTLMYMVVFGGIAGISTDGLPQPLFYLSGILCWQYFSECLNKTSSTFTTNQAIFGKVYFPRLIVPLATVTSNLIRLGIQLLLLIIVYAYYLLFTEFTLSINWTLCLFPVLIILLAGLALGFGILISSMTTKYRDLTVLFSFIIQLWMYATPIIYPLSTIKNPNIYMLMTLNPVTGIVEAFKYSVLGVGEFSWTLLGYSIGFMTILMIVGIVVFNRIQRSFMDTV
ncbi:ABC transporter permease [Bacteroides ovatus]|uniref:Transport permease protein n=1 Tax=Bacteroides ovatus TaxID=28116 RepID=A0A1G8BXS4_BACOV|nr:ABC transporter permease [Bacteroides ovatus]SDH37873.1 lipopolysaccharide transport system permease protein [Bacteroides ovatus]